MATQWHHAADVGPVEHLVLSHDYVAQEVAKRYRVAGYYAGYERDDLLQIARLGIIRAARAYDPARGPFERFARAWAKGLVRKALLREGRSVYRQNGGGKETIGRVELCSLDRWLEDGPGFPAEDTALEAAETRTVLCGLLQRARGRARTVVVLHGLYEISQSALARRWRISQKHVSRLWYQGLTQMRGG